PPLIKAELADEIKSWQGAEGLRGFLATHEYCSADVPVVDEYVLFDLDTEEDYRTLVARYKKYHLPTVKESLMLLEREVPAGKVASLLDHSWNVAKVAVSLARELNRCGCGLDTDLVMAAGLLHDLAKGQSNHATAGASLLRSMGYAAVADVVGTHMDITLRDEDPMSPQELVYLADKLLQGSRITGLEARFQAKMDRYGSDAQARRAITARFDNAFRIKRRIEGIMGRPIETMVTELAASKD
ncbi:MAG: HD domain-containing protein, partial [Deltaproteobacteria bacterium]|nr:HD domain-containing protein [Deltaproteobacteria bacterium]